MRHFGDLQPLGQQTIFGDSSPSGRYNASRSRWRIAVGGIEIGFHREHEEIMAESRPAHAQITPDQLPAPRAAERGMGERFMTILGVATALLLVTGTSGLIWKMQSGATVGRGEVSIGIRDVTPAFAPASTARGEKAPYVIPAKPKRQELLAVIEQAKAGPAAAPAAAVSSAITQATNADALAANAKAVSDAIRSGNFSAVPEVAGAIGAAMASGEAQNWTSGSYHGVVVVGDANAEKCREGTVLLRDGSQQGRTQAFRRCGA